MPLRGTRFISHVFCLFWGRPWESAYLLRCRSGTVELGPNVALAGGPRNHRSQLPPISPKGPEGSCLASSSCQAHPGWTNFPIPHLPLKFGTVQKPWLGGASQLHAGAPWAGCAPSAEAEEAIQQAKWMADGG